MERDFLFGTLDCAKQQQQQIDISTANTSPIASPPTPTKSQPTPNTVTSDTTMCISSDSTVRTTNTASIPKIIENPTIVHTESLTANYYDNIDNKTLRTEYEDTIIFDDSLAPTTVCTDIPNDSIINDFSIAKIAIIIAGLLNEATQEYVYAVLLGIRYGDNTREVVCEILMEAFSSQDEFVVDGAEICETLFELLDIDQQQQQCDIPTDTPPIASPPTKTKIRPNTNKTHTHPNDRHKKKKKQKKPTPLKTRTPTKKLKRPTR